MARKQKAPEKLHKWYKVQESGGEGPRRMTWNVTMDIQNGVNFDDLRQEMDRIQAEHGDKFEAFRIEPQDEYDYGNEHPRQVYYVEGLRWETDEEYQARITEEARIEASRKEYRRQQFEALQKEFGGNGHD